MMISRSRSIPIAPSRYSLLEQQYIQEERAAMIQADYDDYLFYRRIVGGIEKTQEATQSNKIRDQNQELIDHLHYIRHARSHTRPGTSPPFRIGSERQPSSRRFNLLPKDSLPYGFWEDSDDESVESAPSRTNSFASTAEDEETLIFEMDL